MLYIALIMIIIGLYSILEDSYDLETSFKNKELIKIEDVERDNYYKLKALLGLFSIVLGVFSIINYFFY